MNTNKILLIDYDPASISKVVAPLAKAGYEVEVAKDGVTGLDAFERLQPALVLVEAMLPRKHGFEVCQEIKAKPHAKQTPVLITTAVCRGPRYRRDALQIYGCDEYIEKPISDEDLVGMIERFVHQASCASDGLLEELSEALDANAPTIRTDKPEEPFTIEAMSDDELEAKLDSMLLGDDTAVAPPVVPPQANRQARPADPSAGPESRIDTEPKPEIVSRENEHTGPVVFEEESETRVLPAASESTPSDPPVDVKPDAPAIELEPSAESTPEPEARAGGKLKIWGLVAASVAVVGVIGIFAVKQGWIAAVGPQPELPVLNTTSVEPPQPEPMGPPASAMPAAQEQVPSSGPPATEVAAVRQDPVETTPRPVVPPKPAPFSGRSDAERQAALERQQRAEQAMDAAAGSLASSLLSLDSGESRPSNDQRAETVEIDDVPLGTPVRPKARRGQMFDIDDVDRTPVLVRFEQPAYDELARRMRQEGEILVAVLIDETGTVVEANLIREIPRSRLNEAALDAARDWAYSPAVKDGVPVRVWKTESVIFKLE